jgi:hypothetical protein
MKKSLGWAGVTLGLMVTTAPATAGCGAASCALNTHWAGAEFSEDGVWRADVRFEYIDQNSPRAGRQEISVGDVPRHHDEVRTLNRNTVLALDYGAARWGVSMELPYVTRDHVHVHNHHGAQINEEWEIRDVGDARLMARLATSDADNVLSTSAFLFGTKLPTGKTDRRNDDGDLAERSLQPGSGTTDLLAGYHWGESFFEATRPSRGFAQLTVQAPLNQSDGYRPGNVYGLDLGLSYDVRAKFSPVLQLNTVIKDRDRGGEAETDDSGGSFVWLSPGASFMLTRNANVYGFVQYPLYQRVNGVQLTAEWTFTAGFNQRF